MDEGTRTWRGRDGIQAIIATIERWAAADPRIVAMAEFGSNARADRQSDDWSDIDVMLVVDDRGPWLADLGWTDEIGPTWARFLHRSPIPNVSVHQVLFAGGYDADLVVVDPGSLHGVLDDPEAASAVFGHGVRVAFDRSGVLAPLAGVVGTADVGRPTAEEFDALVGQVRFQLVWATKRWRRGELWRAVDDLDDYLAKHLLSMIEWSAVADGRSGVLPDGRRFEHWATHDEIELARLARAAYDRDDAARAILALHDGFEALAARVAAAFGFAYGQVDDLRPWLEARLGGD